MQTGFGMRPMDGESVESLAKIRRRTQIGQTGGLEAGAWRGFARSVPLLVAPSRSIELLDSLGTLTGPDRRRTRTRHTRHTLTRYPRSLDSHTRYSHQILAHHTRHCRFNRSQSYSHTHTQRLSGGSKPADIRVEMRSGYILTNRTQKIG